MKKKQLTPRDRVALTILGGMLAKEGLEDTSTPQARDASIQGAIEESYEMADVIGSFIDQQ
jgi:hypothetical protein